MGYEKFWWQGHVDSMLGVAGQEVRLTFYHPGNRDAAVEVIYRRGAADTSWGLGEFQIGGTSWEQLEAATRLARLVLRPPQGHYKLPWSTMEARLRRHGVEVVYDPREYGLRPLAELAPAEQDRYMDDFRAYGQPHCTVAVLAATPATARPSLAAEFVAGGHTALLAQWVAAGMPVKVSDKGSRVDRRSLDDRLAEVGA